MYIRKTRDIWEVQGFYCGSWEYLTTETTRKGAREMLKCYNDNEKGIPHKIIKKREKIAE